MTGKKDYNWTPEKNNVLQLHKQSEGVTLAASSLPNSGAMGEARSSGAAKRLPGKAKRLLGQTMNHTPDLVDSAIGEHAGWPNGYVVPVSFVAKDWNVSTRRIRALLGEGRLQGRLLDNGYWEVFYPYRYVIGTRGPAIKSQRRPKPIDTPEFMKDHGNDCRNGQHE